MEPGGGEILRTSIVSCADKYVGKKKGGSIGSQQKSWWSKELETCWQWKKFTNR